MPSTAHRDKRPFQPTIADFFPRTDRDSESSQRLPPTVPTNIQSDLLSVGMRVRKSVPEGYKTHKTVAVNPIYSTGGTYEMPNKVVTTQTATTVDTSKPSELLPFCGLHKIGGLGIQHSALTSPAPIPAVPCAFYSSTSSLSSQDSVLSTESIPTALSNPHKRRFEEEDGDCNELQHTRTFLQPQRSLMADDDEDPGFALTFNSNNLLDGAQLLPKPVVYPVGHTTMLTFGSTIRKYAVPHSRRRSTVQNDRMEMGLGILGANVGDDWEEADFLTRDSEVAEMEF